MNYMKEVAKMLGVKLEEEFELKKGIDDIYRFKLSRIGLVYFAPSTQSWNEGNKLLVDLLLGKNEIWKITKPILNEKEKEYLASVIKPFRNKVGFFYKYTNGVYDDYEAITAIMEDCNCLAFPPFKKNTMYKGMEYGKQYTLEELGL